MPSLCPTCLSGLDSCLYTSDCRGYNLKTHPHWLGSKAVFAIASRSMWSNLMTRLLLFFLLFTVTDLEAGKSSRYATPRLFKDREAARYSSKYSSRYSTRSSRTYCYSCQRDKSGRIARSSTAQTAFRKANPCPSTGKTTGPCTGYVIDPRVPLKRGGRDHASNMQWQTLQAARAKDRME